MTWMPWAILSGLLLDVVSAWIARHAVHPEPYGAMPDFRLFLYGTLPEIEPAQPWSMKAWRRSWFFSIKLPSYQWMEYDYDRKEGWHQLHVVWIEDVGWRRTGYYRFL